MTKGMNSSEKNHLCDKDHPQFVLLVTIALTLWVDIV